MYFWHVDRLKAELKGGSIGDREVLPYLLVWIAVAGVGAETAAYLPHEGINFWTYAWSAMLVALPVLGTVAAYRANGAASGVHFANRYLTLGFVLAIRLSPLFIPIFGALASYWFMNYDVEAAIPMTFVDVLLFGSWMVVYYWRLAKHISDVSPA